MCIRSSFRGLHVWSGDAIRRVLRAGGGPWKGEYGKGCGRKYVGLFCREESLEIVDDRL